MKHLHRVNAEFFAGSRCATKQNVTRLNPIFIYIENICLHKLASFWYPERAHEVYPNALPSSLRKLLRPAPASAANVKQDFIWHVLSSPSALATSSPTALCGLSHVASSSCMAGNDSRSSTLFRLSLRHKRYRSAY